MWVGSMRSPMRTSANEELGTLAENNPLTDEKGMAKEEDLMSGQSEGGGGDGKGLCLW